VFWRTYFKVMSSIGMALVNLSLALNLAFVWAFTFPFRKRQKSPIEETIDKLTSGPLPKRNTDTSKGALGHW